MHMTENYDYYLVINYNSLNQDGLLVGISCVNKALVR